jgi:hypothetical protein
LRIETEGLVERALLGTSLIKRRKENYKRCLSHNQSSKNEVRSQIVRIERRIVKKRGLRLEVTVRAAVNLRLLQKMSKNARRRQIKIRKRRK